MVDVFDEVDQALQREKLLAWWAANGRVVIVAIVLTLIGTSVTVLWKQHQKEVLEGQTAQLLEVLLPVKGQDLTDEQEIGRLNYLAKHGKDQIDVLAALQLASRYEQDKQPQLALKTLKPLMTRRYTERILQDLATIRYVTLRLDTAAADDDVKSLLKLVEPLTAKDRPFRYSAQELHALLLQQNGKTKEAQALFVALSNDMGAPATLRSRAQAYLVASSSASAK